MRRRFSVAQLSRDIPLTESADETQYSVNNMLKGLTEVDLRETVHEETVRVSRLEDGKYYIESSEIDRLATIYQDDPMVAIRSLYEFYGLDKDDTYIVLESRNIYDNALSDSTNKDTQINLTNNLELIRQAQSEGYLFAISK